MKVVHVAVGVIARGDNIFITLRHDHLHQGGKWEFPGGKVEQGESVEQAMIRELEEEIGITVTEQSLFEHLEYDYPEKSLKFDFMTVSQFDNQPYGREGQEGRWVDVAALLDYTFPEANVPILERVIKEFS